MVSIDASYYSSKGYVYIFLQNDYCIHSLNYKNQMCL